MSIILTSIARIRDWQALERLNSEVLVKQARDARATRYRIYRNANDASQAMLMVELPRHSDLNLLGDGFISQQVNALCDGSVSDDRVWELTDFAGYG